MSDTPRSVARGRSGWRDLEATPNGPVSEFRQIFVSSVEQDRAITNNVVQELEARGYPCWIAHRDIVAGEMSWAGAIVEAIVDSGLMVVIVSKESLGSRHVLREVTIADDEGVPFLPFRIDDAPLTQDFRFFFSTSQVLNVANLPQTAAIDLLSDSVASLFGRRR